MKPLVAVLAFALTACVPAARADVMRTTPVARTCSSFSQAAEENALSRIYLGIHRMFDATKGIALGNDVADCVLTNALLAGTCPGTLLLIMPVLIAIAITHGSRTPHQTGTARS